MKNIFGLNVNYFKLENDKLKEKVESIKKLGYNLVSSFSPWITHEKEEKKYDFDKLLYFLDLCEKNDLKVVLKPGPFTLDELDNKGVPTWVYDKLLNDRQTWNNTCVTNCSVNYLNSELLSYSMKYLKEMIFRCKKYIDNKVIVGIQVDNNIAMVQSMVNTPVFDKYMFIDFNMYLKLKYNKDFNIELEDLNNYESSNIWLHHELELYFRTAYNLYVSGIVNFFKSLGQSNLLFFVNIPASETCLDTNVNLVSKLYLTYNDKNEIIPLSNIYFNDFDLDSFLNVFLKNYYIKATHSKRILVYFERGQNITNYKFIDTLINVCLMLGITDFIFDENWLDEPYKKFSMISKVSLSGKLNSNISRIGILFNPSYYLTTFYNPLCKERIDYINELEKNRLFDTNKNLFKQLLLSNMTFDVKLISEDFHSYKLIIVPLCLYMDKKYQEKVIEYITSGGKVIFIGKKPKYDEFGNECNIISNFLGNYQSENIIYFSENIVFDEKNNINMYLEKMNLKPHLRVEGGNGVFSKILKNKNYTYIFAYNISNNKEKFKVYYRDKVLFNGKFLNLEPKMSLFKLITNKKGIY